MPGHADILDQQDSLKGSFLRAVGLHLGIAAIVAGWSYFQLGGRVEKWGDPKSLGGGAVSITPVSIPLPPKEGRVNQVANDTQSQAGFFSLKPEPKKAVKIPEPDAIAIGKKKKDEKSCAGAGDYATRLPTPKENQVIQPYRAGTDVAHVRAGAGWGWRRFGLDQPVRCPIRLVRAALAGEGGAQLAFPRKPHARIQNRVSVLFEIRRDGSITNVRISQSSGNFSMDQSAQRAIIQSNPLPAISRRNTSGMSQLSSFGSVSNNNNEENYTHRRFATCSCDRCCSGCSGPHRCSNSRTGWEGLDGCARFPRCGGGSEPDGGL